MSLRKAGILAAAALVATFATTVALARNDEAAARAPKAFTVSLTSRNGSDMVGTARFVPRGKRSFIVVVTVTGGPGQGSTGYPAHVHYGPCSREPTFANPRIEYGLNYVRSGRSRTTVTNRNGLRIFRRGLHSLNVHEPTGGFRAIACGDLPRRF